MTNLEMLMATAKGLGPLKDEVVFVGGATIELYLAHPVSKVRPTDDVDCVVEVLSLIDYQKIEERLRGLGFKHHIGPDVPICRWEYQGILVDIMPVEGKILGFTNGWYSEGFQKAVAATLPDGQGIRIFALPYFIASKIEAFKGRGKGDFAASTDLEDIITVLDGVPDFQVRMQQALEDVRSYLQDSFAAFRGDERFWDYLEGHLPPIGRKERVVRAKALIEALSRN